MKSARQEKILEIISRQNIETQSQLLEALQEEGFKSTQTTLSRDMRDLQLVKEPEPGGSYRYVSGIRETAANYAIRLQKIFRESVLSQQTAQNLVVIKTLPGLANAAGSALDHMNIPGLVGCLAGDDTLFLAMTDAETAKSFCMEIEDML